MKISVQCRRSRQCEKGGRESRARVCVLVVVGYAGWKCAGAAREVVMAFCLAAL